MSNTNIDISFNRKNYIDLDSTYRNRRLYPYPSDFIVDINAATRDTPTTAIDPILLGFPYEANLTSALSTVTQVPLSVSSSNIRNFYQGSILEIAGNYRTIVFYDQITQIATIDPALPAVYPALTQYTIRKGRPFEPVNTTGGIAANVSQIVLNGAASSITNYYVNFYVFLPGGAPPSSYQYSRIIAYNGLTKVATLSTPFRTIVGIGVNYEILEFLRDNVVPLRYGGNQTITNPVPQTISLKNLVIPNRYIIGGYGGTLLDYPFIYVVLQSANAATSTNNIFSNNPYSLPAIFKVPITFNFLTANQKFFQLIFTNMNQTISFRDNDSLRFRILLPNGNIMRFEPFSRDTYFQDYIGKFPIESDPLEQITATFEIQKVSPNATVA